MAIRMGVAETPMVSWTRGVPSWKLFGLGSREFPGS